VKVAKKGTFFSMDNLLILYSHSTHALLTLYSHCTHTVLTPGHLATATDPDWNGMVTVEIQCRRRN
jgi:hypothetical protein